MAETKIDAHAGGQHYVERNPDFPSLVRVAFVAETAIVEVHEQDVGVCKQMQQPHPPPRVELEVWAVLRWSS